MRKIHIVAVGACAIDNILTVPHYPEEDSKLRATSLTRRRGGNCPNSLEVLQQLSGCHKATADDPSETRLSLIATLPAQTSATTTYIRSSLENVSLEHCVFREDFTKPVSSYILYSQATNSRTIINHNALPEMTFEEFVSRADDILKAPAADKIWVHFEGRIPETTLQCMRYLRNHTAFQYGTPVVTRRTELNISVELEKPRREGLQELAQEADVIFYSKSWAEGEGYLTAEVCLREQAKSLKPHGFLDDDEKGRLLVCTWGAEGASTFNIPGWGLLGCANGPPGVTHCAACELSKQSIVDTTGAGDTFIAAMLFGLMNKIWTVDSRGPRLYREQMLLFANRLAADKIVQQGFGGLGDDALKWIKSIVTEYAPRGQKG